MGSSSPSKKNKKRKNGNYNNSSPEKKARRQPTTSSSSDDDDTTITMTIVKPIVLALFSMILLKTIVPMIWPYGFAQPWKNRPNHYASSIDMTNDSLQAKSGKLKKIVERISSSEQRRYLKSPETIIFDNEGIMYALTEEGFLVCLTEFEEEENDSTIITANVTVVADLGIGRPLGSKFTSDGNTLYIADSHLGLTRIRKKQSKKKKKGYNIPEFDKVELIASRVYDPEEEKWTSINFADDVTIGPKSGIVYFTDASTILPDRHLSKYANKDKEKTSSDDNDNDDDYVWDVSFASKLDMLRGVPTGRLLSYNPTTEEIKILAKNIHFANGITMGDDDETFLLVTSTFGTQPVLKYDIKQQRIVNDDSTATTDDETKIIKWTGFPDGIDCNKIANIQRCFVAIPVTYDQPILKLIFAVLPHPVDMLFRSFVMALPYWASPSPVLYGGLAEINPSSTTNDPTQIQTLYQDPTGKDISTIAGVTIHNNKLYFGFFLYDYIGVYTL